MTTQNTPESELEPMYSARELGPRHDRSQDCGHEHGNVWKASECAVQQMRAREAADADREKPGWGVIEHAAVAGGDGTRDVWFLNEYRTTRAKPEQGGPAQTATSGRFVACHGVFNDKDAAKAASRKPEITNRLAAMTRSRSVADRKAGRNYPELLLERHSEADFPIQ